MVKNNIRQLRKELGLTIYDVAKKCNLSATYINNLETNYKNNPSLKVMLKISEVLGKNINEVFLFE